MSKSFCVYKLTFPNGKLYIGITTRFNIRMNSHKHKEKGSSIKPLDNAIRKYGWESVKKEILFHDLCSSDAYDIEKRLIKEFNLTNFMFGYNLDSGGRTRIGSKNKNAAWNKGVKFSDELKLKLSLAKKSPKYRVICSINSTKYSVIAKDVLSGNEYFYKNVTDFCNTNGQKLHTVYNHIRRKSNVLNKRWNVRYKEKCKNKINNIKHEQEQSV